MYIFKGDGVLQLKPEAVGSQKREQMAKTGNKSLRDYSHPLGFLLIKGDSHHNEDLELQGQSRPEDVLSAFPDRSTQDFGQTSSSLQVKVHTSLQSLTDPTYTATPVQVQRDFVCLFFGIFLRKESET